MLKSFGSSIMALADTDNRTIKFNTLFLFPPNITEGWAWSVNCINSDNTPNPTEAAKLSIDGNTGLLTYNSDVSTADGVYVKVHCTTHFPGLVNAQTLEYYFRFKDVLG